MSIRRRAIRARVERDAKLKKGRDEMTRSLNGLKAMLDRKSAAGETKVTQAEIGAAMRGDSP